MIQPITFFVSGEPKGQPRPRAFARNFGGKWQARMYDAGTAEGWKQQVAVAWDKAKPADFQPFSGPVSLGIIFHIARPKSHFKSQSAAARVASAPPILRDDAPTYCAKKPDADNYAKAVMDAMTVLGVWGDDSQVCDLRAVKLFSDNQTSGAQIVLKELDENP